MRYQKIHSQIWNDEKFIQLTPDQQRLFFYILTCPHGNLTGLYVLKEGYACDDLKSFPKSFRKDLTKLINIGLLEYDYSVCVVWIKNFLKHNPITNPNQVKAASKIILELPKTYLIQRLKGLIKGLNEGLFEVLLKPEEETEAEEETETLTETEDMKTSKSLYGEFQNVNLTDAEFKKLTNAFEESGAKDRIENLSQYMASKGKKYSSHYATILAWERMKGVKNGSGAGSDMDPVAEIRKIRLEEEEKRGSNSITREAKDRH